jgi:hypothetical protein
MRIDRFMASCGVIFMIGISSVLTAAQAPQPAQAILPAEVNDLIKLRFPEGRAVAAGHCELGAAKTDSYGVVIATQKDGSLTIADLKPFVGIKVRNDWRLIPIDPAIDVPGVGSMKTFLDEFVSGGKLKGSIAIRCTNPNHDSELHERIGKYLLDPIRDKDLLAQKHVCFQASNTYNSWSCYILVDKNHQLRNSFVQFPAD